MDENYAVLRVVTIVCVALKTSQRAPIFKLANNADINQVELTSPFVRLEIKKINRPHSQNINKLPV